MAGWRTTYGSPLFADHVPDHDDLVVERIRRGGRGADRQDQRARVRGRLPHLQPGLRHHPQPASTPAAPPAAPAGERRARWRPGWCRSPTGSDMGGSLRNPASFCGVVGLRPSLGRVPDLAGRQPVGDDLGRRADGAQRRRPRAAAVGDRRARTRGCRSRSATRAGVRAAARRVAGRAPGRADRRPRRRFEVDAAGGAVVEEAGPDDGPRRRPRLDAHPDLGLADDTFRTLRAWHFQAGFGELLARAPRRLQAVARRQHPGRGVADRRRRRPRLRAAHRAGRDDARVLQRVRRAGAAGLAGAAVPGGPGVPHRDQRPADGDYLDWMRSAYFITVTGCPAISVPAGTTAEGCRSASSSSPRTARTGGCSRSPRRSRRRGAAGSEGPPGRPGKSALVSRVSPRRFGARRGRFVHRVCGRMWTTRSDLGTKPDQLGTTRRNQKNVEKLPRNPCGTRLTGHRTSPTHSLRGERDGSETRVRTAGTGSPRERRSCRVMRWLGPGSRRRRSGASPVPVPVRGGEGLGRSLRTPKGPCSSYLQGPFTYFRGTRVRTTDRAAIPEERADLLRAELLAAPDALYLRLPGVVTIHRSGPPAVDGRAGVVENWADPVERCDFLALPGESPCAGAGQGRRLLFFTQLPPGRAEIGELHEPRRGTGGSGSGPTSAGRGGRPRAGARRPRRRTPPARETDPPPRPGARRHDGRVLYEVVHSILPPVARAVWRPTVEGLEHVPETGR